MDLQELEQEFQTAAAVVQLARVDLFRVAEVVVAENRVLEAEKISALQAGRVDGKNETERKAQMAEILQHEIENVASAEKAERKARHAFEVAVFEYDLLRYRLRIAEIAAK